MPWLLTWPTPLALGAANAKVLALTVKLEAAEAGSEEHARLAAELAASVAEKDRTIGELEDKLMARFTELMLAKVSAQVDDSVAADTAASLASASSKSMGADSCEKKCAKLRKELEAARTATARTHAAPLQMTRWERA